MESDPEVLKQLNQMVAKYEEKDEEILARVAKQQDVRPLLQEKDPKAKIIDLLQQRDSVYRQFPQLSTSELSREELINQLVRVTQAN